jgi:hypothetical protein
MMGKCCDCGNEGKVIQTEGRKFCVRCYNRKWARNALHNPSKSSKIYLQRRIWFFLFGRKQSRKYDSRSKRYMIQERLGFFISGGCCWICGESDPFSLETHHISKRELISLCGSCHQILHRMGWNYLFRGRMN